MPHVKRETDSERALGQQRWEGGQASLSVDHLGFLTWEKKFEFPKPFCFPYLILKPSAEPPAYEMQFCWELLLCYVLGELERWCWIPLRITDTMKSICFSSAKCTKSILNALLLKRDRDRNRGWERGREREKEDGEMEGRKKKPLFHSAEKDWRGFSEARQPLSKYPKTHLGPCTTFTAFPFFRGKNGIHNGTKTFL